MKKRILVIMTAILVWTLATVAMAADLFVGTWKMNLAKSKAASIGTLIAQSASFTVEAWGDGRKVVGKWVDLQGKAYQWAWTAKNNGKDYPVTGYQGVPTVALKHIGPDTLELVNKNAGKEVSRLHCIVSKDGKTVTVTLKKKDAKGMDATIVEVYDRQ
jgi:hypothetical protein